MSGEGGGVPNTEVVDDDEWTKERVWPFREFPLSDDLDSLNEVTPDEYRYIKTKAGTFGEYTYVELHRKT